MSKVDLLQYSMEQSLKFAKATKLPETYNGERYWLFAIVLVQKVDMSKNYAVAENNGDGSPCVVRDYGHPAQIAKILEIRPFLIAGDEILPDFRSKIHIKNYLHSNNIFDERIERLFDKKHQDGTPKTDEEIKSDNEEIFRIVLRLSIKARIKSYYVNFYYNNAEQYEGEIGGEAEPASE